MHARQVASGTVPLLSSGQRVEFCRQEDERGPTAYGVSVCDGPRVMTVDEFVNEMHEEWDVGSWGGLLSWAKRNGWVR